MKQQPNTMAYLKLRALHHDMDGDFLLQVQSFGTSTVLDQAMDFRPQGPGALMKTGEAEQLWFDGAEEETRVFWDFRSYTYTGAHMLRIPRQH